MDGILSGNPGFEDSENYIADPANETVPESMGNRDEHSMGRTSSALSNLGDILTVISEDILPLILTQDQKDALDGNVTLAAANLVASRDDVAVNATAIGVNANGILSNNNAIGVNATAIGVNAQDIADNTTAISAIDVTSYLSKVLTTAQSIASDLEFAINKRITTEADTTASMIHREYKDPNGTVATVNTSAGSLDTRIRQAGESFRVRGVNENIAINIKETGEIVGDTLSSGMTSGTANAIAVDENGIQNRSRSGNIGAVHDRIYNGVFGGLVAYEEVNGENIRLNLLDGPYIIKSSDNARNIATVQSVSSSYTGHVFDVRSATASSSGFNIASFYSTNGNDLKFKFRGDGEATCDGSWTGGGADYAEYFEWSDGNVNDDDRVGCSVSLIDGKIKIAEYGDKIIGVISGNPSVVGDGASFAWQEKYKKDDFGRYIREDYSTVSWDEIVDDKEEPVQHSYEIDKVPDDIVVPEDAEVTEMVGRFGRQILNDNYDESQEYVPREDRKEWDIVGLVGKLRVKQGQEIDISWIKLREISDSVTEFLVK